MFGVDVGHAEADVVDAGRVAGQRDVSRLGRGPRCRLENVENCVARLHAAALTLFEVELKAQLLVEVDSPRVIGDRDTDVVEALDHFSLPPEVAVLAFDFGPPGSGMNGPSRASRKPRMPPFANASSSRCRSGPPIDAWTIVLSGPLMRW